MTEGSIRVLVTGSQGFIGRNLVERLQRDAQYEVTTWHHDGDDSLEVLVDRADAVIHLAGVNRPASDGEFIANKSVTARIVDATNSSELPKRIFLSSSTQAGNQTPYGRSKAEAEIEIGRLHSPHDGFIARLPNVFGKWAKPFYNSVVATFCYQSAHGEALSVHDPYAEVQLIYIDEVCELIFRVLDGELDSGFIEVGEIYCVQVGWLAEILEGFARDRESGTLPDLADPLTRALFSTFHSALPHTAGQRRPSISMDARGWLFELLKSPHAGQVFVSSTRPGQTRGQHWHDSKVEKFCVIQGTGVLKFRPIGKAEIDTIELSGRMPIVVDIPPGEVHAIENCGTEELLLLVWASEIFNPQHPDTWFEAVE